MIHRRTLLTIRLLFFVGLGGLITSVVITMPNSNATAITEATETPTPQVKTVQSVEGKLPPATLTKFRAARKLAESSRFKAAIDLLESHKAASPLEVMTIANAKSQWAEEILKRSHDRYLQGNLVKAQQLALQIPIKTNAYKSYIRQQSKWTYNSDLLQKAKILQSQRRYIEAIQAIEKIDDSELKASPNVEKIRQRLQLQGNKQKNG